MEIPHDVQSARGAPQIHDDYEATSTVPTRRTRYEHPLFVGRNIPAVDLGGYDYQGLGCSWIIILAFQDSGRARVLCQYGMLLACGNTHSFSFGGQDREIVEY